MSAINSTGARSISLLAIDDAAFPLRRNVCLYLSSPRVRVEPVLAPRRGNPDAPDNAATHFYGTVLRDVGGEFRMWYYACHWDHASGANGGRGELREGPTCYARSDDGIHWDRPVLGQVEWRGGRRNNVVRLAEVRTEGVHVIKDDADPDPARHYKMVYNYRPTDRPWWTVRTACSPDGLSWTDGPELPYDGFIEQGSFYSFGGMYYVNGQMHARGEGGHPMGRQGMAIVSPDFTHWLPECGESFLLPEPTDPAARGNDRPYDQAHIGVGVASFGNVLVGLYSIWHNRPYPTPDDWFGTGTTCGDFGLVVSDDGLHFREPVKGHVFLHRDQSPAAEIPADLPHARILCQGNGILNVGDETRIYHGRWVNTSYLKDYHAEVALATLPRDRWGALGLIPDAPDGSTWSMPLRIPNAGAQLRLNLDGIAAATQVRVDLADERFGVLPDWSGERGGRLLRERAGGLDCAVVWPGHSLDELAGQVVRLRIHLERAPEADPRLFAGYLAECR